MTFMFWQLKLCFVFSFFRDNPLKRYFVKFKCLSIFIVTQTTTLLRLRVTGKSAKMNKNYYYATLYNVFVGFYCDCCCWCFLSYKY